ncbi:MAG: hypothetical protein Q7I98_09065, partial [Erysipelotrichaceae bacterium]|nr:hypothetical protein [Erysipelotrichaceae bacterium]
RKKSSFAKVATANAWPKNAESSEDIESLDRIKWKCFNCRVVHQSVIYKKPTVHFYKLTPAARDRTKYRTCAMELKL